MLEFAADEMGKSADSKKRVKHNKREVIVINSFAHAKTPPNLYIRQTNPNTP
jgi:hypothetical protein